MADGKEDTMTAEAMSMINLQGSLPPEIWDTVLSKADNKSLKNARRVNSVFRELSTPLLFDHIVYSVDEKILRNLKLLAKSRDLSKHVQRIYLDTTSYRQGMDTRRYTQLTASYYQNAFDLSKQPNTSPLSEQRLLKILRADPIEDLGVNFLSGAARRAYVAGYATYVARSDYFREQLQDDGVVKQLKDLLPKFSNLKHLETISLWSPHESRKRFENFLRRTLPQATLKSISGLRENTPLPSDNNKVPLESPYASPGQTARRLSPMTPPPNFSGCWGDHVAFDLLTATLRALHESKTKLESLSLPGSDDMSEFMPLRDRLGLIPVPALLTIPRTTPQPSRKTLLLPLFEGLKKLELKLDFGHPGTQSTFKYHMDPSRLCTALHKMRQIEHISIGAVEYPEEAQAESWSIYETLLRSEDDDKDILPDWNASGHSDEGDEDDDDYGGLPDMANMPPGMQGMQGITLAMIAASLGIPPPGTPGGFAAAAAAPPAPATTPASTAAGTPAASSGTTGLSSSSTPHTSPPEDPRPKVHPSTALKPIPWPKLKYLQMFNMSATKEDLARLVRTVAPTLKVLELYNVYFDDRSNNGVASSPTSPASYSYEKIAPHWLETLDLMGDTLSLDKAKIFLSERDTDYVFDLLAEKVEGFDHMYMDIDDMINDFLTEEDARGVDFATFVGQIVAELVDDEDDEDDEVEDWEDEDDSDEVDSDEELPDLI